jgi:hypothetical protein
VSFKRCAAFIGIKPTNTECDWFPIRFAQARTSAL